MKPTIKTYLDSQIESAKACCENEIARMTEDAERANRSEETRDAACALYELYTHFIDAGFTAEQAWELVKITVAK
jgi:hypothetical protein